MKNLIILWQRRHQAWEQARHGRWLYGKGRFTEAAEAYCAALRLAGDRPLLLINFGLALYKDNQKREARAAWERALEMTSGRNAYLAEQISILLRQFG